MTQSDQPTWHIISPGRLELPGTLYAITWDGHVSPVVWWNGKTIGAAGNLDGAKEYAMWHAGQLLAIGLDPTDGEVT